MFSYRPPKASCWGHVIRPNDAFKAIQKTRAFFDAYFEPVEPLEPEGLALNLKSYDDKENYIETVRQKAIPYFGTPKTTDWIFHGPGDYRRVMDFISGCPPPPKGLNDPIRLMFTCALAWKHSALPNIDWPEELLKPENEKWRRSLFMVNLRNGGRISFAGGICIPISIKEPASYEFLGRFSTDAPFKMSPKHFQVSIPAGKNGKRVWRKPDTEIAARLQKSIS